LKNAKEWPAFFSLINNETRIPARAFLILTRRKELFFVLNMLLQVYRNTTLLKAFLSETENRKTANRKTEKTGSSNFSGFSWRVIFSPS
jgi:hypothetical protein